MYVARYSGALTREQFMFREMRIVARLTRQGLAQAEIMERVFDENLFQYPTEKEIRGKCRAALKCLSCIALSPELVEMLADGALMTVRQNYASRSQIMEGAQILSDSHLPLLGCVLNYASSRSPYGGYYGYGYGGYGRAYGEKKEKAE